jgi:hypothetical protein
MFTLIAHICLLADRFDRMDLHYTSDIRAVGWIFSLPPWKDGSKSIIVQHVCRPKAASPPFAHAFHHAGESMSKLIYPAGGSAVS